MRHTYPPHCIGVTFTPVVSGVLIGVLGLAGSIYLILNRDASLAEVSGGASREEKQSLVEQCHQTESQKVKADLALASQRKAVLTYLPVRNLRYVAAGYQPVMSLLNARIGRQC